MRKIILSVAIFMLTVSVNANAATIIPNAGFENGNLSGWTVTGTGGATVNTSQVVSTSGNSSTGATTFTTINPYEGNHYAAFETGSPTTTLSSSSFWVNIGDTVSAHVAMSAEDYAPYVDGMTWAMTLVGANVSLTSGVFATVISLGDFGFKNWTEILAVAPLSGYVTADFSMFSGKDSFLPSIGFVDNLKVISASKVPTPTPLVLLAIGSLGFLVNRKVKVN